MSRLPDFLIIGAMKCATSTLHEQLALQPGIFMSDPKETYFLSDDPVYAQGLDWYTNLFAPAAPNDLCGESTTHYTKLPTYPNTISRIQKHVPNARFIYMMRHPIDRLVSQYIHQWTERTITVPIGDAIAQHPELIAYSQYTTQLQPYFDAFGQDRVLPLFFDQLRNDPQSLLEHACQFIGYTGQAQWQDNLDQQNVSAQRMRVSPIRDMIVNAPVLSTIRKRFVSQSVRDKIKGMWRMSERPELESDEINQLESIFNRDLAVLGSWLGVDLNCANFKTVTNSQSFNWTQTDKINSEAIV